MRFSLIAFILILTATGSAYSQTTTKVPFKEARRYFIKNDVTVNGPGPEAVMITDKEKLESYFGYATTMGANGKPTAIDFNKEFAIAVIQPADSMSSLKVKSLVKKGNSLQLTCEQSPAAPAPATYQRSAPFLLFIVNKKYMGELTTKFVTKKTAPKAKS